MFLWLHEAKVSSGFNVRECALSDTAHSESAAYALRVNEIRVGKLTRDFIRPTIVSRRYDFPHAV